MSATKQQIQAAFAVLRKGIDATGWGSWVSDDKLMPIATQAANAVVAASPAVPAQPAAQQPTSGENK